MKIQCPECNADIEINAGYELIKKRWEKEVPDRKFLSKIGKKGAQKRWAKEKKDTIKDAYKASKTAE